MLIPCFKWHMRRSFWKNDDKETQARFTPIAKALAKNETKIMEEMLAAQGQPVDIDGYYRSDQEKTTREMRPSSTFNAIIDAL